MIKSLEQDPLRKALKERCLKNGCIFVGKEECFYCGFNMRENNLRIKRGLQRDEETLTWRFIATPKPKPQTEGEENGSEQHENQA